MVATAPKPFKMKLNENPITIGDRLRNRRLELRLVQSQVAAKLEVSEDTIAFWENNKVEPSVKQYPGIIQFLGYISFDFDESTIGGRIKKYRYLHGLSQEEFSQLIGVNESTISHYENNKYKPSRKALTKLKPLISLFEETE
jgi:transcriptional regulator with XRE-family HTH domain